MRFIFLECVLYKNKEQIFQKIPFLLQILQVENINHAFHCNRLQNKSCPEAFCTDPQSIIDVVNHNLSQVYERKVKGNIRRECIAQTYKLVIFHATHCNNRCDCRMPLCKEYQYVIFLFILL